MSDFIPKVPIELQIRRIIYEKFNDIDANFTNDQVFEALESGGDLDPLWIVDDTESFFNKICDSGLARNIAQNFTTIYLKLFEPMQEFHCDACRYDICLGVAEEKRCPNSACNSLI